MNKFFTLFLISNFFLAQSFALEEDFMLKNLNPNLKVKNKNYQNIEDEIARKNLNQDLKANRIEYVQIQDEFLPKNIQNKIKNQNLSFDFDNTNEYIIKISPIKHYTTRKNLKIGEYIDFKLVNDIYLNNKEYKKGEIIKGRVENITKNGAMGTPADLTIGNFVLENKNINTNIEITGANRTLWLYPAFFVGNIFFGAGILLYAVRGGHAKLRPNKTYEIKI